MANSENSKRVIVLSDDEVGFLKKVTQVALETMGPGAGQSSLAAQLAGKLEELSTLRSAQKLEPQPNGDRVAEPSARFLVELTAAEIQELHRITRHAYSFITPEERRARLVLREKMLVSSQRLGLALEV